MSVSSDEINFLVYRYLQESGFSHSAFAFAHESLVARTVFADSEVPPGALISFLQKGLQYVEIESHLQEDGVERACDEPFNLIAPHVCRLRSAVNRAVVEGGEGGGGGGGAAAAAAAATASALAAVEAPIGDVAVLAGHGAEAFAVAWGAGGSLASGGADAAARLWRVDGGSTETGPVMRHTPPIVDGAAARSRRDEPCDVTALEWSPDGARLATASSDGRARLWSATGSLAHTLVMHTAAINAIAWSPSGSLLATASGA